LLIDNTALKLEFERLSTNLNLNNKVRQEKEEELEK
jgi:hypothetical protein